MDDRTSPALFQSRAIGHGVNATQVGHVGGAVGGGALGAAIGGLVGGMLEYPVWGFLAGALAGGVGGYYLGGVIAGNAAPAPSGAAAAPITLPTPKTTGPIQVGGVYTGGAPTVTLQEGNQSVNVPRGQTLTLNLPAGANWTTQGSGTPSTVPSSGNAPGTIAVPAYSTTYSPWTGTFFIQWNDPRQNTGTTGVTTSLTIVPV